MDVVNEKMLGIAAVEFNANPFLHLSPFLYVRPQLAALVINVTVSVYILEHSCTGIRLKKVGGSPCVHLFAVITFFTGPPLLLLHVREPGNKLYENVLESMHVILFAELRTFRCDVLSKYSHPWQSVTP